MFYIQTRKSNFLSQMEPEIQSSPSAMNAASTDMVTLPSHNVFWWDWTHKTQKNEATG